MIFQTSSDLVEHKIPSHFEVKVVFLLGQVENDRIQRQIDEESYIYNDLIQENFIDTYDNLTLKTVMMLKWVKNNCVDKGKVLMLETVVNESKLDILRLIN